jgi:hypothetical protein
MVSSMVLKIPLLLSDAGIGCFLNHALFANMKKFCPGENEESMCSVIGSPKLFPVLSVDILKAQKISAVAVKRISDFFIEVFY